MNQITPEQALAIVSSATEPQNITRLTRVDYVNINTALLVLEAALKQRAELEAAAKVAQAEAAKP